MCIVRNMRITLELLISYAFQKYVLVLNSSTLCFIIFVSKYLRDFNIYNNFLKNILFSDAWTKLLPQKHFLNHRKMIFGL